MPEVVVVGASGSVGGALLAELLSRGVDVRASSRNPEAAGLPSAVEVVRADLGDPSTFPTLVDGARSVFLYADASAIDAFVVAARRAGVEHVVLLSSNSVLFPNAADNPIAVRHQTVERALRDSGIAWTFVRPGYLATNTRRWAGSIRQARVVRTAFPDGAGVSLVHERDVAGVAAEALLGDAHRGQAYLVLGGAVLSERRQVDAIADALGEPIEIDVLDVDDYRRELQTTMRPEFVDAILRAGGAVPQVPEAVRVDSTSALLGRPPLPFEVWVRDHGGDFR